MTEKLNH